MAKGLDTLYKNQSLVYKYILYALVVGFIVYFFPKGGKFKYEFQKGKPWQHETLYAPFDFSIKKTQEELSLENALVSTQQIPYFIKFDSVSKELKEKFIVKVNEKLQTVSDSKDSAQLKAVSLAVLDSIYSRGLVARTSLISLGEQIYVVQNNRAVLKELSSLLTIQTLLPYLEKQLRQQLPAVQATYLKDLLLEGIVPNINYDRELSEKSVNATLANISLTRGFVDKGKLIIAKGAVVEQDNYKILVSLKGEYESELWTAANYYIILFGYTLLVALVMMMLFLFLAKYRPLIYRDNTQLTLLLPMYF